MKTKEIISNVKIFIASDGVQFRNEKSCREYEASLDETQLLKNIRKIYLGCLPESNDGETADWYFISSEAELDSINMILPLDRESLGTENIGDWVLLEKDEGRLITSLSEYISDLEKFTKELGVEMEICSIDPNKFKAQDNVKIIDNMEE